MGSNLSDDWRLRRVYPINLDYTEGASAQRIIAVSHGGFRLLMAMDSGLKQRLIGAVVLVAVAVVFLPMLVNFPAPDSEASGLSFKIPDAPDDGAQGIRLPLDADAAEATILTEEATEPAAEAAPQPATAAGTTPEASESGLPPTAANGKYVVHFASFATPEEADLTARSLQARSLPAFTENVILNGRPAVRVRIGPYQTQAEAEIVRVEAAQARSDVKPRVFMLIDDAADAAAERTAAALQPPSPPARTAAPEVGFVVQLGAFSTPARASALQERLRKAGIVAFTDSVNTARGHLTRVNAGPVSSRREADQLKAKVKSAVDIDGVVRSHP